MYIYLINETNTNNYKIGYAKDVNKRIKQLQTSNSNKLNIINTYKIKNTSKWTKLEIMIHNHYKFKRLNGEWFNLEYNDTIDFISVCEQKDKIIDLMIDNPFF